MRSGFTTGSCAAAAAKAAACRLLLGIEKKKISIQTPAGIRYTPQVHTVSVSPERVVCGVIKDGGDDPDVTNGAMICAEVYITEKYSQEVVDITIKGGDGVGKVTKPGLDQPVGEAAINHVPREMIRREVTEVCETADFQGGLTVIVSVPEGERIAANTFNERLGILGGISIIGTSGLVEPMSTQALLDTIRVELNQRKALGYSYAAITPGNYGRDFMKRAYGYDLDRSIKCSNFIGVCIDMAAEIGFDAVLLTGHIGKLVKVSGGIMNTHSKEGDCRMELLTAAALRQQVSAEICRRIADCVSTEEAVRILEAEGRKEAVMNHLMDRILFYLRRRAQGSLTVECVMYSNDFGELAKSEGADTWLTLLAQEQEQRI